MTRSALRAALYAIGGLSIAGAVVLALFGCGPAAIGLAGWALVLVVGLLIERWRYKPLTERPPGPGWTATTSALSIRRPASGHGLFPRGSGERRYVAR